MLFFHILEKGPRAAKISWRAACGPRAALWPCLGYRLQKILSDIFISQVI